jgi:predicted transposase/invertase (TIGR01784 family)
MTISKFLNPKNDVAFKKVFGTEKHKDILIHFINDILELKNNDQIQDVEFLSPIQDPFIASKKQSIIDVLCKDKAGVQMIVEMQVAPTKGFEKRAQYYASKAYSRQLDKSGKYSDLKEVIFIAISDCIIFKEKKEYKSDHVILDKNTYEHDLKDFSFTFIELPKFTKTKTEDLNNIIEKWCYFFKHADETKEEDLDRLASQSPVIKIAYEALNQFNWTESELLAYDEERKRIMDNEAAMDYQYDNGVRIGEARGKAEGEKQKSIEIARKMLDDGLSIDLVQKYSGLSIEEIKKLK